MASHTAPSLPWSSTLSQVVFTDALVCPGDRVMVGPSASFDVAPLVRERAGVAAGAAFLSCVKAACPGSSLTFSSGLFAGC